MLPNFGFDAWGELFKFTGALGVLGMAWFRKGSQAEDEMVVEASDLILDNLSNADNIRKINAITGKNLRDQLSIEEVLEMDQERKLRQMRNRN